MQVKKDEVKNAILKQAEIEFYNYGFKQASIRNIVKGAGTTIGNFYNYFESKEALFDELVRGEYNSFIYFINNHKNIGKPDYLWKILNPTMWKTVLQDFLQKIMPVFSDKFVIIIESSKGTRYEDTKKVLINLIKEHYIEHIMRFDTKNIPGRFPEILAEHIVDGIVLILRKYKSEEIRKEILVEYLLFYFIGTMGTIGDWDNIKKTK